MKIDNSMESQDRRSQTSDSETIRLLQILSGDNPLVRPAAARALGKINSCGATIGLLQILAHKDSDVRAWAAWALGQIGTDAVVIKLLQALKHQVSYVRTWATWALGEIGSPMAINGLIDTLKHKDVGVRWRAAAALGKIGTSAAIDQLIESLNDEEFYVRWRVAAALGKIKQEIVVSDDNENTSVFSQTAYALEEIKSEEAVNGLLRSLSHEDGIVRGNSIWALGQIGTNTAIAGLKLALTHHDPYIRGRTASVLGKIGCVEAISNLLQTLSDRDLQVRLRAVSALGKIGNKTAVYELLRSLKDKHANLRSAAAIALGRIGSAIAIDGLQQALDDTDDEVRHHAAEAIKKIGRKTNQPLQLPAALNTIVTNSKSDKIPTLLITSCAEASEHLLCTTRGPLVKHLISIASPGIARPEGYVQVPHRLRLEFHDIETPCDDPDYVMATPKDLTKVVNFVSEIEPNDGNLLIHCQAGISRSAAVALIVCSQLLGAGQEKEAFLHVIANRRQAIPNLWMVELGDIALGRKGKLLQIAQKHQDVVFSKHRNYQGWDGQ